MLELLWGLAVVLAQAGDPSDSLCPGDIPATPLEPGTTLERSIAPSGCHAYRLAGPDPVRVTVTEQGVDVSLLLARPGSEPERLESGAGRYWLETARIDAPQGIPPSFAVIAAPKGLPGRYTLAVEPLAPGGLVAMALAATARALAGERPEDPAARARLLGEASDAWTRAGEDKEAAWLQLTRSRALYDRGDLDGALAALEAAEARLAGPDHAAHRLRLAGERANLLIDAGRADEVEPLLRSAIREASGLDEPRLLAHLHIRLGLLFHSRDELDHAREEYERAAALLAAHPDLRLEAMVANNLAGLHLMLGEPSPAFRHFDRARELAERSGDRDGVATILVNAAHLHASLGRFDQALERLAPAIDIFEELGREADTAGALWATGQAYLGLNEPARAAGYLAEARRLAEGAGDVLTAAATLALLGDARRMLGEPEAARALHVDALERYRSLGRRADVAAARLALATDDIAAGRPAAALESLAPAIEVFRGLGYRRELALALLQRGIALAGLGRHGDARAALTEAGDLQQALQDHQSRVLTLTWLARVEAADGRPVPAIGLAESAAELLETLRGQVTHPDLQASLFGSRLQPYDELVRLHMAAAGNAPRDPHLVAALAAAERARAHSVQSALGQRPVPGEAGAADSVRAALLEQVNGQLMRLRTLNRRLDEARAGAAPGGDAAEAAAARLRRSIGATERTLARLRLELDALDAAGRTEDRALSSPDPGPALARLLDTLPPDAAVLSYHVGGGNGWAWLLRRGALEAWPLPAAAELEAALMDASEQASHWQPGTAELASSLRRLAGMILPPAPRLAGVERLVLVPDGLLHRAPWAALPAPGEAGAPLAERFEILHAPAIGVLAREGDADAAWRESGRIAVFADPVMSTRAGRAGGPANAGLGAMLERLGPLPFSDEEAAAIARLAGDRATLFTGPAASKSALETAGLERYAIVHFATHAVGPGAFPEYAGLVLSQVDPRGRPMDGLLHLEEIYGLSLDAGLVVLSACRSATGREVRGEGPLGLGRAFLLAGARRVLLSQWDVPDDVTAILVAEFYEGLLGRGLGPAAALREAQLALRRQPGLEHPFNWAGFILVSTTLR